MADINLARKYLVSREVFRDRARREFALQNPRALELLDIVSQYVAWFMFSLSGKDLRHIPNGKQTGDLVVSFTRTHFIVVDLTVCSELIDAATLLRKQFELIARLNELSAAASASDLERKVPNVKMLKTWLRRLYGDYSEIAHSASAGLLHLLGSIEHDGGLMTPVYPVLDKNSYVAASHIAATVLEFGLWGNEFLSQYQQGYDWAWEAQWFDIAIDKYSALIPDLESR